MGKNVKQHWLKPYRIDILKLLKMRLFIFLCDMNCGCGIIYSGSFFLVIPDPGPSLGSDLKTALKLYKKSKSKYVWINDNCNYFQAVFRIRDLLVRIRMRILGSVPQRIRLHILLFSLVPSRRQQKNFFFSGRDNNLSRSVVRYELGVDTQLIFFFLSGWK
jgi:hypothetical protein